MFKNVKTLEFGDYIWNHHEKCSEISTNMPCNGLVKQNNFVWMVKPIVACKILTIFTLFTDLLKK